MTVNNEGDVWIHSHGNQQVQFAPGLAPSPGSSLASITYDCLYFRHRGSRSRITTDHRSIRTRGRSSFARDATFRVHLGRWFSGYYAFESENMPGYFIRHSSSKLYLYRETDDDRFRNDASYRMIKIN